MLALGTEAIVSCFFPALHMGLQNSLVHPTNTKAASSSVLPIKTTRQLSDTYNLPFVSLLSPARQWLV